MQNQASTDERPKDAAAASPASPARPRGMTHRQASILNINRWLVPLRSSIPYHASSAAAAATTIVLPEPSTAKKRWLEPSDEVYVDLFSSPDVNSKKAGASAQSLTPSPWVSRLDEARVKETEPTGRSSRLHGLLFCWSVCR